MTITITGYSVIVKRDRINDPIESGNFVPPNGMCIADDHIWRFGFMAESDANEFIKSLEKLGLNGTRGPDSDAVIINEFNQEIHPYCEWLQTAMWEKAVLAWKVGTDPKKLIAREGFDPKVGSGLSFHDRSNMDHLEFLRLEGNVEVYFNKELGQEVFIGRTSQPVEALFKSATATIRQHYQTVGDPPLKAIHAKDVGEAVETLSKLLTSHPDWWQALFFHGKGLIALHRYDEAFVSLERAYEIEPDVEAIPRELCGICLELGKFNDAVRIGEKAAALRPDNAETLGNLAVAYLLAGNLSAARKAIDAGQKIDPDDAINQSVNSIIADVESGQKNQPNSMAQLNKAASKVVVKAKAKRPFWKFWK